MSSEIRQQIELADMHPEVLHTLYALPLAPGKPQLLPPFDSNP
jgi:hypothetical protein